MIEHNGILFPDAWGKIGYTKSTHATSNRKRPKPGKVVSARSLDSIKKDAREQLQEKLNAQHARWSVLP